MNENQENISRMQAAIEAILFTMGDAVTLTDLAAAIGQDEETTKRLTHNLMDSYRLRGSGIGIREIDGAFIMCTNPECYDYIINLTHRPVKHQLTDAMLEALAVIAYKQPVTRAMVEHIRGVNSDRVINRLIEYQLVEEVGRLDAPGRPILFGTTQEFLRVFGLKSLMELPVVESSKVAQFESEAQEEAGLIGIFTQK